MIHSEPKRSVYESKEFLLIAYIPFTIIEPIKLYPYEYHS